MQNSLKGYDKNVLVKWLIGLVGEEKAIEACIKTTTHWTDATVFWYINYNRSNRRRQNIVKIFPKKMFFCTFAEKIDDE